MFVAHNAGYVTPEVIYFHHLYIFSGSSYPPKKNNFENRRNGYVTSQRAGPGIIPDCPQKTWHYPAGTTAVVASRLTFPNGDLKKLESEPILNNTFYSKFTTILQDTATKSESVHITQIEAGSIIIRSEVC